jgi:hypothetical protein
MQNSSIQGGPDQSMKIIAIEKDLPGVSGKDFAPHLKAEAAQVWALYREGVVRELYFRADRSDAVLVLECTGTAEAQEVLARLPLVRNGLIAFELIPLAPYPGFERLFAK